MTSASTRRASIKAGAIPAWKDKLREECFSRLQASRAQLLASAREARGSSGAQPSGNVDASAGMQTALQHIIAASSAHLREPSTPFPHQQLPIEHATPPPFSTDCSMLNASQSAAEDLQMREHGTAKYLAPSCPDANLSPDDYLELMRALEEALYADVLDEEAEYLASLELQDVDAMFEAHFARDAAGAAAGGDRSSTAYEDESAVLCPICQEAWLVEQRGLIVCPRRHLRLDASIEGQHLGDLKARLAGVIADHAAGGCCGQPQFLQMGEAGLSSMVMTCAGCGAFEVVF